MSAKILKGEIVSTKMMKTLVVKVGFSKKHHKYNKNFIVHSKFKVHCEDVSKYKDGEIISIMQSVPKSKTKNWVVVSEPKVEKKKSTPKSKASLKETE